MSSLASIALFILSFVCAQTLAKLRRNFATKSRYSNPSIEMSSPEGCTPLHLNMVFRHGTRYPGKKDIKGMNDLSNYINELHNRNNMTGNLKFPWVKRFKYGDKFLAKAGEEEMYDIAKRIQKRFQSLFLPKYKGEQHHFVSTMTPRTSQSASAFAFGLFEGTGNLGPSKFQPVAITTTNLTEPVLRFFDACSEYKGKVSKNKKTSLAEFHKFKEGPEMRNLKEVLDYKLNISFTSDQIQFLFLSCAYERAIYGDGDLCSVLDDSDLDIIEYLYDLKNYWKRGYGYKINYEMSCLLLKNLTESMENAVQSLKKSETHSTAIFHFSHAETIIPLVCLMGLFKDDKPLLSTNFQEQKSRLFRTSNIAPFAGNIAVVLFSCDVNDLFFVQVLSNELPIPLPCCEEKELCPFQQFKTCFANITKQCDFAKICDNQSILDSVHNEL